MVLLIAITFILAGTPLLQAQEGFEFREMEVKTGIIFAPTSTAQLAYDEFTLVYHFELRQYYDNVEMAETCISQLDKLCRTYKELQPMDCKIYMGHAKNQLATIMTDREIIESLNMGENRRKRRGLVNVIGSAESYLFGTLSANDGEKYNMEIQNLKEGNRHHNELLEKQVMIMEKLVRTTNTSMEQINSKFSEMESVLHEITTHKVEEDVEVAFAYLATLSGILFMEIDETSRDLKSLLTHATRGAAIDFIAKTQLGENLKTIQNTLKQEKQLPIDANTDNPYSIYRSTVIRTSLHNKRVLIELSIPILDREIFQIYEAIPIPSKLGNGLGTLKVTSQWFLTNTDKTKYIPISQEELNTCFQMTGQKSICKHRGLVFGNKNEICELSILEDPYSSQIPESCEFYQVPTRNYFINLQDSDSFYCKVASEPNPVVICDNGTTKKLEKSGILKLQKNCHLRNGDSTLKAGITTKVNIEKIINPEIIPNELFNSLDFKIGNTKNPNMAKTIVQNNFQEIHEDINDYKARFHQLRFVEEMNEKMQNTSNLTWTAVGLVILVILAAAIFLIIQFKCSPMSCLLRALCSRTREKMEITEDLKEVYGKEDTRQTRPDTPRPDRDLIKKLRK